MIALSWPDSRGPPVCERAPRDPILAQDMYRLTTRCHVDTLMRMSSAASLVPALVDEVLRTRGRLLSATASFGADAGLSGAQTLVLVAVARAPQPPTVPQIGRSLGHTRQAVQRVVDALAANGFVEFVENPDHKRARRLVVTDRGRAAHAAADARSRQWARQATTGLPPGDLATTIATLRALRVRLETSSPGTD